MHLYTLLHFPPAQQTYPSYKDSLYLFYRLTPPSRCIKYQRAPTIESTAESICSFYKVISQKLCKFAFYKQKHT